MGIENRDYFRKSNASGWRADWGLYGLTPVVKYLIIINVVVWLAQIVSTYTTRVSLLDAIRKQNPAIARYLNEHSDSPEAIEALKKKYPHWAEQLDEENPDNIYYMDQKGSYVEEWFQLESRKAVFKGQVWRLLTHAFCHSRGDIFHIGFNMLFLYWFGCTLEAMYGHREFLLFYVLSAIIAALAYVGLDLWTGTSAPAVGASGAVMGVTMLYAMHFPRETIRVFWLIPVQMRWLMIGYVIWDLHPVLLQLAGQRIFDQVAHAAHLGGLAFGFIYYRLEWRLSALLDRLPRFGRRQIDRPRLRIARPPDMESIPDPDTERVDELLQKIYESGQASLTDEERELLQRASECMRNRRT